MTGAEETVPADGLFPMIGADPQTGWLPADLSRDEAGFLLTGADLPGDAWPLAREPFPLETSMPGVLAVGDVRHGSVKRVASAVGEGSVAIRMLHQLLAAEVGRRTARRRPSARARRRARYRLSGRRGTGPSGWGRRSESRIISSIRPRASAPSGWSTSIRFPAGSRR